MIKHVRMALVLLVGACSAQPLPFEGEEAGVETQTAAVRDAVPGEVLIQFRPGATEDEKDQARGRGAAQRAERITDHDGELELATLPPGLLVADAAAAIAAHPAVAFAEPNFVYTHTATSNDPYYANGSLWGMYGDATAPANAFGSGAGEAWAAGHTGSDGVYVGIIDEGLKPTHPDLQANVWVNPLETVNGRDDDGNGLVDDVNGYDFANNDGSVYDGGSAGKLDAHGTHVAGTIGAVGGNAAGVAGVAWNVKLISAKFLGRNGGTTANAIRALDYLTNLKKNRGLNIVAANNSWGGGGYSQALLDAIVRAAKEGILFVVAAGNGGRDGVGDDNDRAATYPSNYSTVAGAGYEAVIAVASITSTGAKSTFSNFGANTVDLGAPGSSITSTLPNGYGAYSGTSMATPHVSGAVAVYAARWSLTANAANAAKVRSAILGSAAATSSLTGKTATGGRLDVNAALAVDPNPAP